MQSAREERIGELDSFVSGLRRDLDAVRAGLTLPYSSGAVEGHVNRLKTLKRQMYGRREARSAPQTRPTGRLTAEWMPFTESVPEPLFSRR